jgi:hypothetical protein
MSNFADAIEPSLDLGGAISFPIAYNPEEAGQTFVEGTPVMVLSTGVGAADGGVAVWDGTSLAPPGGIAGIAISNANNLGSTGAGQSQPYSPVLGPGSNIGSYAANSNQALAVITPPMVPFTDGTIGYYIAAPTTRFIGKLGTSATVTPVATSAAQVGLKFGLTKDTGNNFWYVDTNKTGGSAAVLIVGLSPLEAVGTVGGHVLFVFLPAVAQIVA